jgi:hypothetical protein
MDNSLNNQFRRKKPIATTPPYTPKFKSNNEGR